MIIGAALYIGWIVVWTRRESQAVKDEYEHELGVPTAQRTRRAVAVNVTLLVAGIVVIVVGADLLVDGAVQIAQTFRVSDAVIGLTIVAVGTSAAELVTTMVSTVKDDRDIAIGNILGSSVYNILLNLGMTAVVAPVAAVVEPDLARIDIPVMVAATMVCIPVFITRQAGQPPGGPSIRHGLPGLPDVPRADPSVRATAQVPIDSGKRCERCSPIYVSNAAGSTSKPMCLPRCRSRRTPAVWAVTLQRGRAVSPLRTYPHAWFP